MTSMPVRKPSVAMIVAATLVTVTTIVFGVVATIDHLANRRSEEARLLRFLNAQTAELADALALPVWNIDRAQIDKILDSQSMPPQTEAVVVEAAGVVQARSRNAQRQFRPSDGKVDGAGWLVAQRPIVFSGERIGTVRLFVTRRYIQQELRRQLVSMGVTALAVDVLLILTVYFVLWRNVLRPLTEIDQYAVAVSRGDAPAAPKPTLTRELESLRSSIGTMIRQLEERYEQLQEQEELTNTAINCITGVFLVQDREGHFIRWNENMERLAPEGSPVQDRVGRPLVLEEDRELVEQTVEQTFKTGHGEVEARFVGNDGVRSYAFSARRMDVRGQSFLVATGTDTTERRHAEAEQRRLQAEIARSAAEWKQTFDTVTTPIIITEPGGAIVRLNRAALVLAALPEETLPGMPIDRISDGEPWHTASQLVSYIADEGHGTSAETRDADGRTWDITITHFSTPSDGAERFIVVMWEITGIVELQESLRRSETLSAMGNLVAGVAHEVRNPLFGISATLDAYHKELSKPEYVEFAAILRQEVNRLVHLMQELLEYGKPGALSIERGRLVDVVERSIAARQQAARAARVQIVNEMTGALPALLMDASRLRQVFENLIDNAIQHSDPGRSIHVSGEVIEHAGRQWIECCVDDEGTGFAPDALEHVFDPFFTMRDGGTGLGLSIVQRIVQEHSGKVFAANRPDGGGSIRLLFPIADNEASMPASAAS